MKKLFTVMAVSAMVLVGCGSDEQELTADQKFQIQMAKIDAQKAIDVAKAENQVTTMTESVVVQGAPMEQYDSTEFNEVQYAQTNNQQAYSEPVYHEPQYADNQYASNVLVDDGGMSTGSAVALGLLGGAVTGYMASELLDDGWSRGYDSYGNERYYNSKNLSVGKSDYKQHKSSHKVKKALSKTAFKKRFKSFKAKAKLASTKLKAGATVGAKKAKEKVSKAVAKAKPAITNAKAKVAPVIKKGAAKAKYSVKKAKVLTKKVIHKAKKKAKKKKSK